MPLRTGPCGRGGEDCATDIRLFVDSDPASQRDAEAFPASIASCNASLVASNIVTDTITRPAAATRGGGRPRSLSRARPETQSLHRHRLQALLEDVCIASAYPFRSLSFIPSCLRITRNGPLRPVATVYRGYRQRCTEPRLQVAAIRIDLRVQKIQPNGSATENSDMGIGFPQDSLRTLMFVCQWRAGHTAWESIRHSGYLQEPSQDRRALCHGALYAIRQSGELPARRTISTLCIVFHVEGFV